MKTIALFGGSGRSGQHFLQQALEAGYQIRALARTPSKIEEESNRLEVIEGDVLNYDDVEKTVRGTDLVVSLFGHVKGSPDRLQTEGTRNITEAMKNHGVDRIISLSGGGLPYPEKDEPRIPDKIIRFIMGIFAKTILEDAKAHAEVLKKSGLDWVIVRAPRLTDEEKRGDYRVGWVGMKGGTQLGRADLADFVLKLVEDDSYDGQMPFVAY